MPYTRCPQRQKIHVVKFPFICRNILAVPAYGVYVSQLIRYPRTCGPYHDFLDRGLLPTGKLLNQQVITSKIIPGLVRSTVIF